MPATTRVGLLARRTLGFSVIAAMLAVVAPVAPAYAGTLSVVATNDQAGLTAAPNTATAKVTVKTAGLFFPTQNASVSFTRTGTTDDQPAVSSKTTDTTSQTLSFSVALASANPGTYNITVTEGPNSDSCTACFTVGSGPLTVGSVNPSLIAQGNAAKFVITGTRFARGNYDPGASVANSNYNCATCDAPPTIKVLNSAGAVAAGITLSETKDLLGVTNQPTPSTTTTITKVVTVASGVAAGAYDVVVTNTDDRFATCAACLTVTLAMTGTASPTSLGQGTTNGTITITGANFPSDVTGTIADANDLGQFPPGMTFSFVRESPSLARFFNVNVDSDARTRSRVIRLRSASILDGLDIAFAVTGAPNPMSMALLDGKKSSYGQGAPGVRITVTGEDFVSGAGNAGSTISFSPPDGITVTDSQTVFNGEDVQPTSTITATFNVAAGAPVGAREIIVTNPNNGGSAVCVNPDATDPCELTISAAPAITSISPAQVGRDTTKTFRFNGTDFSGGSSSANNPTISMTGVTGGTSTLLGNLDGTKSRTALDYSNGRVSKTLVGPQNVSIINNDTLGRSSCTACFTITNLEVSGPFGQSAFNSGTASNVTVSGFGFDKAATVELVKTGLGSTTVPTIAGTVTTAPVTSTDTAADGTSLRASFPLNGVDPGTYAFRVTNPGSSPYPGVGQGGIFNVTADSASLTSVAPSSRGAGAVGETIQLTGANFAPNPIVTFSNPGITVTSLTRLSATRLDAVISISPSAALGAGTVKVANTDNASSQTQPFTVVAGPKFSSPAMTPNSRPLGSTFTATLKGQPTTFPATKEGAELLFSKPNVVGTITTLTRGTAAGVNTPAVDDTITASVNVGSGEAGPMDVIVRDKSTGGRAICAGCFTATAAPPSAPVNVVATAGNGQATVTWAAGLDNGATITQYRVTSSPGGFSTTVTGNPASSPATVVGLTNGVAYRFFVVARNSIGEGPASALSAPVTPRTVPGTVTGLTATPTNGAVNLSWTAPGNGGATITEYLVTTNPGATTTSVTGTSATISGLTNGTAYTFAVKARNAAGDGPLSGPVSATPRTTPGIPTGVTATAAPRSATVNWTAPSNGGSPITKYVVTASPGGQTATVAGDVTTATVTGLASGVTHTFTVAAFNVAGSSGPSSSAAATTPITTPTAPTAVTALAGDTQVTVRWTAPSDNGGTPITGYTVRTANGDKQASATATSLTVTGLTNGTAYTFTVIANNAQGASAASTAVAATPKFATKLTTTRSAYRSISGSTVTFSGVLTRVSSGARIANAPIVVVFVPEVGTNKVVRLTTSSTGVWSTRHAPIYNTRITVRFPGTATNAAVSAITTKMAVLTRVTRTSPSSGSSSSAGTTLLVKGFVSPNKAGKAVSLMRGTTRVGSALVARDGTFSIASRLARGTYTLHIAIAATTGNAAGRSGSFSIKRT